MFSRKKETTGPYRVEKTSGNIDLQNTLNERHSQGYDVVAILQQQVAGSSSGRDVVFKLRADWR